MDALDKQSVIFKVEDLGAAQIVAIIRDHKPRWAKSWRCIGDFRFQLHVVFLASEIEGVPMRRNAELGHFDVDRCWELVMKLTAAALYGDDDGYSLDNHAELVSPLDVFNRWMHRGGFMPRVWRKGK